MQVLNLLPIYASFVLFIYCFNFFYPYSSHWLFVIFFRIANFETMKSSLSTPSSFSIQTGNHSSIITPQCKTAGRFYRIDKQHFSHPIRWSFFLSVSKLQPSAGKGHHWEKLFLCRSWVENTWRWAVKYRTQRPPGGMFLSFEIWSGFFLRGG